MRNNIIIVLATLAIFASCKQRRPGDTNVSIVGGTEVTDPDDLVMKSTVFIDLGGKFCTGTIIGPNHLVSAGHCFSEYRQGQVVKISFGAQPAEPALLVTNATVYPAYKIGDWMADLSIVVFDGKLPDGLQPAIIPDHSTVVKGSPITVAGYGITATGKEDYGILRKVADEIGSVSVLTKEFKLKRQAELGSCNGDSGGPIYLAGPNAARGNILRVIGATSRGTKPDCSIGDSINTDLTRYKDWMMKAFAAMGKPIDLTTPASGGLQLLIENSPTGDQVHFMVSGKQYSKVIACFTDSETCLKDKRQDIIFMEGHAPGISQTFYDNKNFFSISDNEHITLLGYDQTGKVAVVAEKIISKL